MCYNTQHNDTQHNDTKHKASFNNVTMVMTLSKTSLILKLRNNDTQHDDIQCDDSQHGNIQYNDTQHNWLHCDNIEDTQHLQHIYIYTCIMTLSTHT